MAGRVTSQPIRLFSAKPTEERGYALQPRFQISGLIVNNQDVPPNTAIFAWMTLPYKRFAQFGGRSSRREFWLYSLFLTLQYFFAMAITIGAIAAIDRSGNEASAGPGVLLVFLPVLAIFLANFVPGLALSWRRFQDFGAPGWLAIICVFAVFLLSLLAWIAYMVVMSLPPQQGENAYGPPVFGENLGDIFS